MIYIQHTPDGIRAEREPFDGGVAYEEVPTAGFAGLRDLITDTAADLSQSEPFWTAGCLADALIKRGVTGASANNELVEALGRMTEHYVSLAAAVDRGNWNPEEEQIVIDARALLTRVKGGE